MRHTSRVITSGNHQLFTQQWTPDTDPVALIVLSHGYGEHSGRYAHLGKFMNDDGYAVYTHDHDGHGQSTDKDRGYFDSIDTLIDDYAEQLIQAASVNPGKPLFPLGHSMGGLIVLAALIRHRERLSPLISGVITNGALLDVGADLPAPLVGLVTLIGRVAPHLPLMRIDPNTVSRDPAVVAAYQADPLNGHDPVPARVAAEFIRTVRFVRANAPSITTPILMMHGLADRLVKPEGTQYVYNRVASTDKSLKLWDGLAHECFNEPEHLEVMEWVAGWIDTRINQS